MVKANSEAIEIDEALKNRPLESSPESFNRKIMNKMDDRYSYLRTLIFAWDDDQEKFLSRLPNGKITFVDQAEDLRKVEAGVPYICAIYEREREAFARIIGEQYKARMVITKPGGVVVAVRIGNKAEQIACIGQSLAERMMYGYNKIKELGESHYEVVIKENEP